MIDGDVDLEWFDIALWRKNKHPTEHSKCHLGCGAMGFKSNNVKLPEELSVEVNDALFKQGLIAQREKILRTNLKKY